MRDVEYFLRRGAQEAALAQTAKTAAAVAAHHQMSTAYFELADRAPPEAVAEPVRRGAPAPEA
jgi:hypothetical protein